MTFSRRIFNWNKSFLYLVQTIKKKREFRSWKKRAQVFLKRFRLKSIKKKRSSKFLGFFFLCFLSSNIFHMLKIVFLVLFSSKNNFHVFKFFIEFLDYEWKTEIWCDYDIKLPFKREICKCVFFFSLINLAVILFDSWASADLLLSVCDNNNLITCLVSCCLTWPQFLVQSTWNCERWSNQLQFDWLKHSLLTF